LNRRAMKKIVLEKMASFLVLYTNTKWRDVPDFFYELEVWVFRNGPPGTEAEQYRLRSVMYEIHRETHGYEVKKER